MSLATAYECQMARPGRGQVGDEPAGTGDQPMILPAEEGSGLEERDLVQADPLYILGRDRTIDCSASG